MSSYEISLVRISGFHLLLQEQNKTSSASEGQLSKSRVLQSRKGHVAPHEQLQFHELTVDLKEEDSHSKITDYDFGELLTTGPTPRPLISQTPTLVHRHSHTLVLVLSAGSLTP